MDAGEPILNTAFVRHGCAERETVFVPAEGVLGVEALHIPANAPSAQRAWHDVFPINDTRFVVSIGNVAGADAEAAAIRQAIRRHFGASSTGASHLHLRRAADAIFVRGEGCGDRAATAILGIVDCSERTFTYVTTGHPPPFLRYRNGELAALPADVPPADAGERDYPPAQVVVDLHDAAVLVLYSNVRAETSNGDRDYLCRLQSALRDERMQAGGTTWLANELLADGSHDDVALVVLTFGARGASGAGPLAAGEWPRWTVSWSFDATAAASHSARRAFLACLGSKDNGGKAIDLSAAELIYGELLGNVVRHAPGPVEIALDWTEELPVLHVRDNGPGFRSRRARERLPADFLSESGRGLFIINALAAKFSVRTANGRGTHASVTLPLA